MNWKLKAFVQNSISRLPSSMSYDLYYRVQRSVGGLRVVNPTSRLRAGIAAVRRILAHGGTVEGATVLEVGTGRRIALPLALWLCGAHEIVTVDLNPYLTPALVFQDIAYMRAHSAEVRALFGDRQGTPHFEERFSRLTHLTERDGLERLFAVLNLRYLAPADATRLALPAQCIDVHLSYTVLEHVPPDVITAMIAEARRLLRPTGTFVHCIDFTDHFAHSDPAITTVNFLQYDEAAWQRYAGNRYMYHNRLRADEFAELLRRGGLEVRALEVDVNERALAALREGRVRLAPRFAAKPPETNAASSAWVTAGPGSP
jgi:SAM-dependent methyltransferase